MALNVFAAKHLLHRSLHPKPCLALAYYLSVSNPAYCAHSWIDLTFSASGLAVLSLAGVHGCCLDLTWQLSFGESVPWQEIHSPRPFDPGPMPALRGRCEPGIERALAASLPLLWRNLSPSEGRFMCPFPALRGERIIWPCAKLSSEYT